MGSGCSASLGDMGSHGRGYKMPPGFPVLGNMTFSLHGRFLVICAGLLSSAILEVPGQDVPSEEECTPQEIYGCYYLYYRVLREYELKPDQGGNFDNTAFHAACSAVKEKAPCHKKIVKCPQKDGMDLTRQEKGYKLMRDFICDIELFKDFQKALPCEEHEKLIKCDPGNHEEPPYDPNGTQCRSIINGWVCREEAFNQSCPVPPSRVKEAFSKIGEAHALLMGCDYKSSAASSVAPQGFFLCLITLYSLRWLQAL